MRALVLGGAGFVGSHIVDRLLARDECEKGVVVDNLWTGRRENLPRDDRLDFIERSVETVWEASQAFDEVWHLASPASPVWYTPEPVRTVMANVFGARVATQMVRPGGTIFYTSTSEVYGDPLVSPQPESYRGSVSTTGPRASYDEGKRCAEALLTGWFRQTGQAQGCKLKIARIFNCFGPRTRPDDGRAVSNFLTAALRGENLRVHGPGTQTRCFGHVDDIVEGLWQLMYRTPDEFVGPLNIGLDEEISVIELARFVCRELFDNKVDYEIVEPTPDDPQQRRPDLTLCRAVLPGWQPQIHWTEGVASTLEWFKQQENTQ